MKIARRLVSLTFVMAVALAMAPASYAQPAEQLLLVEDADADANAAAANTTDALPKHAARGRARVGRVNRSAFVSGRVAVTLPDGRQLTAERSHEERGARGELTWVGEFDEAPGSLLVVTIHRGAVTGFLHHGSETYELGVTRDGRSVLFEVNEAALPDEGVPVPVGGDTPDGLDGDAADSLGGVSQADLAAAATATDVVVQDLLVVYTPKSVTRAGSAATLESKIINAVAAANAAYASSAVNIRLNLVGLRQTSYVETGDMGVTLSRLRATSDGYMDEVHTVRNQTGADLVSLVSDDSNYCGIAYVMSSVSSSFATSAFSVVFQDCFSNHTLAHEIGHNQGNSHDRPNGGSSAYPYSFGYRTCDNLTYTNGQTFRTVMGYPCSGAARVNYFSNPNIYYNGAPMGVAYEANAAQAADNARSMNNTAAVTAAFRSAPASTAPAAPTGLTGTATSSTVSLNWLDQSANESGFALERAVGGSSFAARATLASNTRTFADSGLSGNTTYHYRLRAFNAAGSSAWTPTKSLTTPTTTKAPSAPTPSVVTVSGSTSVVAWANVSGESSFRVVRETYNAQKKVWSATAYSVAADVLSITQSLTAGTYRYNVSALNSSGTSAAVIATCATCGADGSFTVTSTSSTAKGKTSKDNGKSNDKS